MERGAKPPARVALPIDRSIPGVVESLRRSPNLVLEAPPGAGKTTRIPPALLPVIADDVIVLEPRRLAARMAARRVAAELGERVGETAGYQVRFEEVAGPRTRLRFLTEGVLTRRLLSDPELEGTGAVILDEFHERHLDGDLALTLLRRLQKTTRPDLRIVVMSATMDPRPVAEYLGGCPVKRSEGRLYELSVSYTPSSPAPLEEQAAAALEVLIRDGLDGDVLVFLPGAAEIRRAMRACQPLADRAELLVLPLHGDLPPEEQDRAVAPSEGRKVILSTNVAESSVTIPGVTAVIDSGLARVASHSPWSGLPVLRVARVSQASANQRAGRAGRTGAGRVIRLYPAEDFARRPAQDAPEVARRELSQTCLELRAMGIRELEWLEPPPAAAWDAAAELLRRLGAFDREGHLTETGRRMASYPLHPRLARLLLEADNRGAGEAGCAAAAVLSAGQRFTQRPEQPETVDLLELMDSPRHPTTRKIYEQLRRVRPLRRTQRAHDEALLVSVLSAFPDRVARRRRGEELNLASGGGARLPSPSSLHAREWMVAVDIEERREHGLPLVRLASAIEPQWLLDLFPDRVSARETVEWNRTAERVEAVSALQYEELVIEESRGGTPDPELAAALLAEKAWEAGIGRFADPGEVEAWLAREAFAAAHSSLPGLGEEDLRLALESLCRGQKSFRDLEVAAREGGLIRALQERLPASGMRLLNEVAPERIRLARGRQVRVQYARNQAPWVASRLQDFFGMHDTPRVAKGQVPLVLHLLAPNQRPVQTTTDLAGFWERLYPTVRKELSRRYPKHAWPERPG